MEGATLELLVTELKISREQLVEWLQARIGKFEDPLDGPTATAVRLAFGKPGDAGPDVTQSAAAKPSAGSHAACSQTSREPTARWTDHISSPVASACRATSGSNTAAPIA